jgi:hypothetical protein
MFINGVPSQPCTGYVLDATVELRRLTRYSGRIGGRGMGLAPVVAIHALFTTNQLSGH